MLRLWRPGGGAEGRVGRTVHRGWEVQMRGEWPRGLVRQEVGVERLSWGLTPLKRLPHALLHAFSCCTSAACFTSLFWGKRTVLICLQDPCSLSLLRKPFLTAEVRS